MSSTIEQACFDPDQFARDFVSKVAAANRSVRDVFFLNTVFMWRKGRHDAAKSTSASKSSSWSSIDAEGLVEHLMSVYDIQADSNGGLRDDSVTLERIHFAFPVVGCKVAAVGAEQRKAGSQLNRVMAIIECPAFGRFCSTLLRFADKEGALFVDAYCWGQYLNARKAAHAVAGAQPCAKSIRQKALQWKSNVALSELAEILEDKLAMFKHVGEMMLDESNVDLGVAELHRSLRSVSCVPNVNFIVDQAIHERPSAFTFQGEANETFLDNYEVLHFSGALLCYLTLIRKRLCRDNKASHMTFEARRNLPELWTVLKEAALAVLQSPPERILELMRIVGLRVSWGSLVHAAHVRVRPLIRNFLAVDVPNHMTRLDMARLGLQMTFTESNIFRGCYPSLIHDWAMEWRRITVETEL